MKALRPYQERCLNEIDRQKSKGRTRVLCIMPTGTGKTFTFSTYTKNSGGKGLVVAHRDELLKQSAKSIGEAYGDPGIVGIERARKRVSPMMHDIVCASVQTIGQTGSPRLDWFEPDIVNIDEAHHAAAPIYQNTMHKFNCYGLHPTKAHKPVMTIGWTATPHRMDNRALFGAHETAVFEDVAFQYTLREAIQDGWLVQIRGYTVRTDIDLSAVKQSHGDFNLKQLAELVDTDERNTRAIREWLEVAKDRQTIVFCVDVDHAYHMAAVFKAYGFSAAAVVGEMDEDKRAQTIADFASGKIQILTNVMVLTEGFDEPSVSCVVMLRPTQSWSLYTQMVGRGTRLYDGKDDLIVIDVEDNCRRHNLAAIPAILGLPPRLSLKGRTLSEAAAKVEELGDKLLLMGINPEERAERLGFADPEDLEQLESLLEQVDLLAMVTTPVTIADHTELAWLQSIDGGYVLRCGISRDVGVRRAMMRQDVLSRWWVKLTTEDEGTVNVQMLGDLAPDRLFKVAEDLINDCWPGFKKACARAGSQYAQTPTEMQLKVLRDRNVSEEVISQLTRAQASSMLDNLLG